MVCDLYIHRDWFPIPHCNLDIHGEFALLECVHDIHCDCFAVLEFDLDIHGTYFTTLDCGLDSHGDCFV